MWLQMGARGLHQQAKLSVYSATIYASKDSHKPKKNPAMVKSKRNAYLFIVIHLALYTFTHTTEKEKLCWNAYQMRLFVKFALSTKLLNNENIELICFKHFYT